MRDREAFVEIKINELRGVNSENPQVKVDGGDLRVPVRAFRNGHDVEGVHYDSPGVGRGFATRAPDAITFTRQMEWPLEVIVK